MTKPGDSQPRWGTLVGWGTLLMGIAAMVGVLNGRSNSPTQENMPTAEVIPIQPKESTETENELTEDESPEIDEETQRNPLPTIEFPVPPEHQNKNVIDIHPSDIIQSHRQDAIAVNDLYIGEELRFTSEISAGNIDQCQPLLTEQQIEQNSRHSSGPSSAQSNSEFFCIKMGTIGCYFQEEHSLSLRALNAELFQSNEKRTLTLIGTLIAVGNRYSNVLSEEYSTVVFPNSPYGLHNYYEYALLTDCEIENS